ncbi:MAG: methyltransferase domain-containing protein [Nanoarchaeota archaeon]|nr:methyltransferase domain-containing protein [Nanoarchaeota archaeon]
MEYDKEIMDDVLKLIQQGKVLELGAGEGNESLFLAEKGFEVTCLDINEKNIKKIQDKAEKENLKIKTIIKDLREFKIEESFDLIFSIATLHILEDKEIVLDLIKQMKEHTKTNGLNLLIVFRDSDPTCEDPEDGYFGDEELKEIYKDWKIENYEIYDEYDDDDEQTNKLAYIIARKPKGA